MVNREQYPIKVKCAKCGAPVIFVKSCVGEIKCYRCKEIITINTEQEQKNTSVLDK